MGGRGLGSSPHLNNAHMDAHVTMCICIYSLYSPLHFSLCIMPRVSTLVPFIYLEFFPVSSFMLMHVHVPEYHHHITYACTGWVLHGCSARVGWWCVCLFLFVIAVATYLQALGYV